VNAAVQALGEIPTAVSLRFLRFTAPPLGPQDQPDYLNAAVALETALAPEALLDHTQRIELQQGRVRKAERWGPRTLDLDIMLFGDEVINTERLTVPHYDMKNRGFMLWPLFEIAPELIFPDGIAASAPHPSWRGKTCTLVKLLPLAFTASRKRLPKIIAP
jgi:2-amino-4-hydroxy-6-hydroxymethyldihydropteridine diphosphokinase